MQFTRESGAARRPILRHEPAGLVPHSASIAEGFGAEGACPPLGGFLRLAMLALPANRSRTCNCLFADGNDATADAVVGNGISLAAPPPVVLPRDAGEPSVPSAAALAPRPDGHPEIPAAAHDGGAAAVAVTVIAATAVAVAVAVAIAAVAAVFQHRNRTLLLRNVFQTRRKKVQ